MKKTTSLLIALVMVLVMSVTALSEPFYLEEAGVTIDVPEGMTAQDVSEGELKALLMKVDGREDISYAYVLQYVEALEGRYLEDLTEDEAFEIGKALAVAIENPAVEMAELDEVAYLVIANGAGTQLQYLTILNGWVSSVAVAVTEGATLQESEIELCAMLLASVTFDE